MYCEECDEFIDDCLCVDDGDYGDENDYSGCDEDYASYDYGGYYGDEDDFDEDEEDDY